MLAAFVVVSMVTPTGLPSPSDCTPLQAAVWRLDAPEVRRLAGRRLLGFVDPQEDLEKMALAGPCKQRTPLMLAAERGELEIARILISSGASINASVLLPEFDESLADARCLAIANNHHRMVGLLDENGAVASPCTEVAELFRLLATDDVESLQRQLSIGPTPLTFEAALRASIGTRVNRTTDLMIEQAMLEKLDFTRLYEAAILERDVAFVKKLSDGGARVMGVHTLALAIAGGQSAMVAPLLTAGAKPTDAKEAILEAVRKGDRAVLRALLDHSYRGDDETPLLLTAIDHLPDLVPELIRAGVQVEIDDEDGRTPLMAAAKLARGDLVELLLERGAFKGTGNLDCKTAAYFALQTIDLGLAAKLQLPDNVVPGRAARMRGITCGTAAVTFEVSPTDEIRLKAPRGGEARLPLSSNAVTYLNAGLQVFELTDLTTNKYSQATLPVENGRNHFTRRDFGLPAVAGMVDSPTNHPDDLKHIVQEIGNQRPAISRCVVDQNRRAPKLHGTMLLNVHIGVTGKVTVLHLVRDEGPSTLFNCISTLAGRWSFGPRPYPSGPIDYAVKY